MLLKIIAYGLKKYISDPYNWIDAAVVIISII